MKKTDDDLAQRIAMNAIGMAALLGELAVYVPEEDRERIEAALDDAAALHELTVTQVLRRYDVEPKQAYG